MNNISKYTTYGLWVFVLIIISSFATIYAMQVKSFILLSVCVIAGIILSSVLLMLVMRYNSAFRKTEQEIRRLKQREDALLQKEQTTNRQTAEQAVEFRMDEVLTRIMPSKGTLFDNIAAYTEQILQNMAKELEIVQGLVFVMDNADQQFHVKGEYAYFSEEQPRSFPLGETLSGQVAKNQQMLNVSDMPEGYITILSGLGKSNPRHLIIAPIIHKGESIGVIELASFKPFGKNEELMTGKITELMANQLNELRK